MSVTVPLPWLLKRWVGVEAGELMLQSCRASAKVVCVSSRQVPNVRVNRIVFILLFTKQAIHKIYISKLKLFNKQSISRIFHQIGSN